ncbi:hypothetical protein NQZ68_020848 [Dissostichus eleginoides]|nr:hypothetical protein NQZ68_020848 [Dissostichus eleginoides]
MSYSPGLASNKCTQTTTSFKQDLDPGPTRCLRSHRLPQAAARHPAAAHLQQRQISSFPICSSRALLQLQAYLFTSSAGLRIKLQAAFPSSSQQLQPATPQTRTREEKGKGSRAPRKLLWLNGKPPRLAPMLTIWEAAAPG